MPEQRPPRSRPAGDGSAPPPGTSARGARPLAVLAVALAAAALYLPPAGAAGMIAGGLAHVKGYRPGLYAAVLAGLTTVLGTALVFLTG